jgi:hypothetical protein
MILAALDAGCRRPFQTRTVWQLFRPEDRGKLAGRFGLIGDPASNVGEYC